MQVSQQLLVRQSGTNGRLRGAFDARVVWRQAAHFRDYLGASDAPRLPDLREQSFSIPGINKDGARVR
jgi:hypothetical protein